MARLQEARILKNEHDNVKDIMFDFEKKLIASEDTLAKIKSRIYKSEEIAANLTSKILCLPYCFIFHNYSFYISLELSNSVN